MSLEEPAEEGRTEENLHSFLAERIDDSVKICKSLLLFGRHQTTLESARTDYKQEKTGEVFSQFFGCFSKLVFSEGIDFFKEASIINLPFILLRAVMR